MLERCKLFLPVSDNSIHIYNSTILYSVSSAGIGRTGTYIALDALYKTGLKTRKVNIPEYVVKMRENRMNMVQTTV